MTTTLSTQFKRHNYSTLPTIDVEVLTDQPKHCTCGREVVNENAGGGPFSLPKWVHTDGAESDHRVSVRSTCAYCGSDEATTFKQHSWYDAVECDRCGGVTGWAIGD